MWIHLGWFTACWVISIRAIMYGKHIQHAADEKRVAEMDTKHAAEINGMRDRGAEDLARVADRWESAWKSAEDRAERAEARCVELVKASGLAIGEARAAIAEAVAISKLAASTMFGTETTGDVVPAMSVGQADRQAAIKLREEREQSVRA